MAKISTRRFLIPLYALLSTDDILAIKAYLTSLKPVDTAAPTNSLLFPFNQRPIMRAWKLLFPDKASAHSDNSRSAAGTGAPIWLKGSPIAENAIPRGT
jgi:hypothetical protein